MKLGRAARHQLAELIAGATPLRGDFFRSVAFQYFHPDDVISGEGTRVHGGRFAPIGVKAVYASRDEETAMREVTVRKNAMGGRKQINIGELSAHDVRPFRGDAPESGSYDGASTGIGGRRYEMSSQFAVFGVAGTGGDLGYSRH